MLYCKDPSSYKGRCCCNCISQIKLTCSPSNKTFGKGKVTEIFGYACVHPNVNPLEPELTFFDHKHGMCEMHTYPSEFKTKG